MYEATLTIVDDDIWGHLRFGQDILNSGNLAPKDSYSFLTGDSTWFNHEWLSDVSLAFFFHNFGWAGVVCAKAVIILAIVGVLAWSLVKKNATTFDKLLLLLGAVFLLGPSIRTARPHIITCLNVALLLTILKQRKLEGQSLPLWLPLVFAVWSNLHGGCIAGLITVLAWTFFETVLKWRNQSERKLLCFNWAICLGCALAILINPYGFGLFQFVFRTQTGFLIAHKDEVEWQQIPALSIFGLSYLFTLVASIITICISRQKRDPVCLAVWALYALAPFVSFRHLALFSIATIILLGEHICDLLQRRNVTDFKVNPLFLSSTGSINLLFSILILIASFYNTRKLQVAYTLKLPSTAVAMLKHIGAKGNIVCDFEWGEYIIWHLGPRLKVSSDGRLDNAYSPAVRLANSWLRDGVSDWDIIFKRFPVDFALVEKQTPSFDLIKQYPGWTLVYEDEVSGLFCPSSSPYCHQLLSLSKNSKDFANLEPVFLNTTAPKELFAPPSIQVN